MTHPNYSIDNFTSIIQAKLMRGTSRQTAIKDILIDSRRLISTSYCVFFALKSKRNDGHKYINELYNKGIRLFVVSKLPDSFNRYNKANFFLVDNTIIALQLLTSAHRKKFNIPVIGITGSNGKTIIKEWIYQLLNPDKKIIRSPKSYNSQIGVPLSVWQLNPTHDLAIFEAGISEPDEMDKLQSIIKPNIGIFSNIGSAHNENFINNMQKAGEKLKLFTKVDTLIYCIDHSEIQAVIIRSEILESISSFTWSYKGDADVIIKSVIREDAKSTIEVVYSNREITFSIPFTDKASIENAIHCLCLLLVLGYSSEIIAKRMPLLHPVAMRLELKEGINNCTIINDSYNSDINSLSIALDFLSQQKQHIKKTLIISDILQSGQNEIELYEYISNSINARGIQKVIGIGTAISNNADLFTIEKYFFKSTEEFLQKYPFTSFINESILLKGARVYEFEQISKALQQKAHETVLEINLNSLIHNLNYFRSRLPNTNTKIMAMVKAFSYGSGSFEIANILQYHHVDYLTVAYSDEGVELRKAGINLPIMVMNPDAQGFDSMIKHQLEPEIYSFRILDLLEKSIQKNIIPDNKPVKIHIKLDTGMHRLGFQENDINNLIKRLKKNKSIYLQSVFSHLASSEDPMDDSFTIAQINLFEKLSTKIINEADDHIVYRHILNSAGTIRFPEAQYDMVRLGIGLYGISSDESEQKKLENVSTLKTSISQIKHINKGESIGYNRIGKAQEKIIIAIIPIGYADGLNRNLGNGRGRLFINGHFANTIGNICMDMCMLDVTNIPVNEGDEVIVFGNEYPITNLAKDIGTIPYEILTSISRRVKRVYFHE